MSQLNGETNSHTQAILTTQYPNVGDDAWMGVAWKGKWENVTKSQNVEVTNTNKFGTKFYFVVGTTSQCFFDGF